MTDDLSAYERQRLENIKRNAAFLANLGFAQVKADVSAFPVPTGATGEKSNENYSFDANLLKRKKEQQREQLKQKLHRTEAEPVRRSSRLQGLTSTTTSALSSALDEVKAVNSVEEESDDSIDYEQMPQESNQLDDYEFSVYTKLRKWRLLLSKELELEAYKVMQNRTICEMIRRRRNDPHWATTVLVIATDTTTLTEAASTTVTLTGAIETTSGENIDTSDVVNGSGNSSDDSNNSDNDVLTSALLHCWGIGPSKATSGGFGRQAAAVLDEESNVLLLAQSRTQPRFVDDCTER